MCMALRLCVCVCVCRGSSVGIDAPNSYTNIKYHFFKTFEIDYFQTTISGMNITDSYCEVERVYV